jgi:cytochrome c oxidase subunit III
MEIGTLKSDLKTSRGKSKRGLSGGSGKGPGDRGKGGGGGDDGDEYLYSGALPYASNKSRILMIFLLIIVMMTFAGLIGAYIVISTNGVLEWRPVSLPFQVWISTALIVASSVAYSISQRALNAGDQRKNKNYLLATTVLGGMFIASQILAWLALVNRGVYMESNPYAGFFYIMTALHAVHVIGGIVALGYLVLRVWESTTVAAELEKRREVAGAVGWYWHFMDGLWIVLLILLGFWK